VPYPRPTPDLLSLGIKVATQRRQKGWSVDRLFDESGVGRRTIINLEGAFKTPRVDMLFAVAVALDVPVGDLVDVL